MKDAAHNPWAARFAPLLDREVIRQRAAHSPQPLRGLLKMPVEHASRKLKLGLEELFYPSSQCLDLLEKWVGMAFAHCLEMYPDNKKYLQGINEKKAPLPNFSFPCCLTGLGGVGKTELLKAFHRILPSPSEIDAGSGYPPIPSQSYWAVTINASKAPSDLLVPFAGGKDKLDHLVETCRKLAYRNGVGFYTMDEFQHATTSASANARVTQMLLCACYLGIPVVFSANYSLIYRLKQRPQEDQQRLLADIDVLLPDAPDSEDWTNMLKEQQNIAPDVFDYDPVEDGPAIHALCAGIKRAEKHLLLIGFKIAHKRKSTVTLDVLREAYQSHKYATFRHEVEMLLRIALDPGQTSRSSQQERNDLRCPIELPKGMLEKINAEVAKARKAKVADEMLRSSMTPEELANLRTNQKAQKRGKTSQRMPSTKRSKTATAEELRNNAIWFKNRCLR